MSVILKVQKSDATVFLSLNDYEKSIKTKFQNSIHYGITIKYLQKRKAKKESGSV